MRRYRSPISDSFRVSPPLIEVFDRAWKLSGKSRRGRKRMESGKTLAMEITRNGSLIGTAPRVAHFSSIKIVGCFFHRIAED